MKKKVFRFGLLATTGIVMNSCYYSYPPEKPTKDVIVAGTVTRLHKPSDRIYLDTGGKKGPDLYLNGAFGAQKISSIKKGDFLICTVDSTKIVDTVLIVSDKKSLTH